MGRLRVGAVEVVFLAVLGTGLIGGRTGFFNDPGTPWHLRLGREILRDGAVPRVDSLTFTRSGTPWVDQSWLFDVGLAWVVDRGGWSAVVAATAVLLAWIYSGLAHWLIRLGTRPISALAVAILAAGIGSVHFLARPHLFTFGFVLLTLAACRAFHDRRSRWIWAVPPLTALWANLHGGFLAGPLIVATAAVGEAISGGWDADRRRKLATFVAVFGLTTLAPLANPYGFGLYRHVFGVLVGSGVTDLIDEYKSAPFGHAEARSLEWVVLALVALPVFSKRRPERYDLVPALVWLHLALGSIRHAPLFGFAVAPVLGRWIDGLLAPEGSEDSPAQRTNPWPIPIALSLGLLGAVAAGLPMGGPDPLRWPLSALPALAEQPGESPLFHEQDWGGLIEADRGLDRLAYLDDRFELWGRAPIVEYVEALTGGPTWDRLRDRDQIALVWVRPDRGLARRLLDDPAWEVVHRDEISILFKQVQGPRQSMNPGQVSQPDRFGLVAPGSEKSSHQSVACEIALDRAGPGRALPRRSRSRILEDESASARPPILEADPPRVVERLNSPASIASSPDHGGPPPCRLRARTPDGVVATSCAG